MLSFKTVFIATTLSITILKGFAQDTPPSTTKPLIGQNAYYVGKDGELVNKDSAIVVRVFNGYDSILHLYDVFEYDVKSGQRLMAGKSSTGYPLTKQSFCVSFYINGKRKSIINYEDGIPTGNATFYYPNGKLYQMLSFNDLNALKKIFKSIDYIPENEKQNIIASYDSTGKQMVVDGKGHFVAYSEDFKTIEQEGEIDNGKRTGTWKGQLQNYNYTEKYQDGKFISGVSTDNLGNRHSYNKLRIDAEYPTGLDGLYTFISKNIKYPKSDRANNVQGRAYVTFVINEDGSPSNFVCLRVPSNDVKDEILRVLHLSQKWTPSLVRGMPSKQVFTLPVTFSLN